MDAMEDLREEVAALGLDVEVPADAAAVVSGLLGEVQRLAAAYEDLQGHEENLAQELLLSQAQLFPLRKDNSRLARENDALHARLIETEEARDRQAREASVETQLAQQNAEKAKYAAGRLEEQLREAKEDIEALRKRMGSAAKSHLSPGKMGDGDGGGGSDESSGSILFTRGSSPPRPKSPRRDENAPPPPSPGRTPGREVNTSHASVVIAQLKEEVLRLSKLLDSGGKDHAGAVTTAAVQNTNQIIAELNWQIDFLNNELAVREASLIQAQDSALQVSKLESTVAVLRKKLRIADSGNAVGEADQVRALEAEKKRMIERETQLRALLSRVEAQQQDMSRQVMSAGERQRLAEHRRAEAEEKLAGEGHRRSETLREIETLRQQVRALDADREGLQSALDATRERDDLHARTQAEVDRQMAELASAYEGERQKVRSLAEKLREMDRSYRLMQTQLRRERGEKEGAQETLGLREREILSLGKDLTLLTREHQAMSAELATLNAQETAARMQARSLERGVHQAKAALRALQLEKGDLLESYRATAAEKAALVAGTQELGLEKEDLRRMVAEREGVIRQLKGRLLASQRQTQASAATGHGLERAVAESNGERAALENRCEQLAIENTRVKRELWALRQLSKQRHEDLKALRDRVASDEEAMKQMRTQLASAQSRPGVPFVGRSDVSPEGE